MACARFLPYVTRAHDTGGGQHGLYPASEPAPSLFDRAALQVASISSRCLGDDCFFCGHLIFQLKAYTRLERSMTTETFHRVR